MSKLTGLHSVFRKSQFTEQTYRFSDIDVRQVPWEMEMFKTYGDRFDGLRGTLDQSSAHGLGVEVCCPDFLRENQ